MVYARIEAFPNKNSAEHMRLGGALVNCWIKRNDIEEAVSIARRMIAERGWHSEVIEEARFCSRDEFSEESREYFDQALTDDEVLVFYTHPKNEDHGA
ncbi:MAG: hypothetical protein WC661_12325 [Opitutaceae bacterium]|jgi:hypothetical protein